MTTMQGCISGQDTPLDDLPSWKRELILRKRANVRMHGGFGLPTPAPPMAGRGRGSLSGRTQPSSSSVSGPHQAASRSLSGPDPSHPHQSYANNNAVSSRLDGARESGTSGGDRNENKNYELTSEISSANENNMHHKGLHDEGPRVASPTYSSFSDSCKDQDEELSYGPGIVSKLKNRYMSLAMRERQSRPPLRRFNSLEDLLDEPRPDARSRMVPDATASHRREVMKRARSVDSLSSRVSEEVVGRGRTPRMPKSKSATSRLQSSLNALGKDDIIIIETTRPVSREAKLNGATTMVDVGDPPPLTRKSSSSSLTEEQDLPPPDTVRHVKRMFEPTAARPLRGAAARVAAHKAQQASKTNGVTPAAKPALKAKPVNIPTAKVAGPPSPGLPVTIEEAKSTLRHVGQVSRPGPRPTMSVRPNTQNGDIGATINGVQERLARTRPGLTPVTASVTAPLVNGEPRRGDAVEVAEGIKRVSQTAVTNIRKESHSQDFNFTGSELPAAAKPAGNTGGGRASSPTPTPLPASPPASHRVPPHSPFVPKADAPREADRVLHENLKNVEKSRPHNTAAVEPRRLEADPVKQTKVEPVKPTKVEPVKPTKVEPVKPSKVDFSDARPIRPMVDPPPIPEGVEPKWSPKKTAPKSEVPKSPADDLVRSSGKGSLVEAVNTSNKTSSPSLKPAGHRDKWHQQDNNTIVFNFTSSKKTTPDYIENDGIDLSKRRPEQLESGYVRLPGWSGDSSTDADDDEFGTDYLDAPRPGVLPAPSGIVFEGEAVIINGRSNLQRQPKSRKLNLSFDDGLTQTYEYPSELSLLEDVAPSDPLPSNTSLEPSPTQGGLASYTPSKIQLGSTFELGVSRTPAPVQAPPPAPSAESERVEEDYLRPADESETVTWSAESTSDMLF